MDPSHLPLFLLAATLAYLLLRLGQSQSAPLLSGKFRGLKRLRSPGISLFKKPTTRKGTIALTLGLLAGAITIGLWSTLYPPAPLLLPLLAAGLFLEELAEPRHLIDLPSVLGLINQLLKFIREGDDIPTALGRAAPTLPDGPVKERVKKALVKIEERLPPEKSLTALRGHNPYLDQLVSDCIRAGWKNTPALEITLELLLQRSSRAWQRASRVRTRLDSLSPYIPVARSFIIGGAVLGVAHVLGGHQLPIGLVAAAILAAVVLRFMLLQPLFRRMVLTSALLLALLSPGLFVQPAQATAAQASQPEIPLEPREIQPSPSTQAHTAQVSGIFELAECRVRTGYASGYANLRSGPGMEYPVVEVLPEEEALVYLGETGSFAQGEWRQVRTGSLVGWIYAPLCQTPAETETPGEITQLPIPARTAPPAPVFAALNFPAPQQSCQVETGFSDGWANLRSGPGMDYPVLIALPEATKLAFLREAGDFFEVGIWHEVRAADNTQGWIYGELCPRGDRDDR